MRMILQAFAKINVALSVGPRRGDGFHELRTIFQTISLADLVMLEDGDDLELEVQGAAPVGRENLVLRAARLLAREAGIVPRARILLSKKIPMGGGLGGGSSDAAATLIGLDRLWRTGADSECLHRLSQELGSDVAFFLLGGTALGLGRGEDLFAIPEMPHLYVLLVLPGVEVATAEVFREFDEMMPEPHFSSWPIVRLWTWGRGCFDGLENDLEACVLARHPPLEGVRKALRESGAEHALMSGSGSTFFGLFRAREGVELARERIAELGFGTTVVETLSRASMDSARWLKRE